MGNLMKYSIEHTLDNSHVIEFLLLTSSDQELCDIFRTPTKKTLMFLELSQNEKYNQVLRLTNVENITGDQLNEKWSMYLVKFGSP